MSCYQFLLSPLQESEKKLAGPSPPVSPPGSPQAKTRSPSISEKERRRAGSEKKAK